MAMFFSLLRSWSGPGTQHPRETIVRAARGIPEESDFRAGLPPFLSAGIGRRVHG